jgi:hypothetical protein
VIGHSRVFATVDKMSEKTAERRAVWQQDREVIQAEESSKRNRTRSLALVQLDERRVAFFYAENRGGP